MPSSACSTIPVHRCASQPRRVSCNGRDQIEPAGARDGHGSFLFFFNDTATTEIYTLSLHDALPISRMETRLPRRPTGGSLTSPSYLVRKRTLGPPLENNPEIPPSSRDEGLRLL